MENSIENARLHPTSLMFDIISHGRSYLIPAMIALFSAAKGNTGGIIVAGLIFFPAIMSSFFHYFTLRYRISNQQLVVTKGFIFRSIRTVPVSRIQNVDSVQNVLHRIFQVAEVRVETASGTEPEATLRVLSLAQLERLRSEIFELQEEKVAVEPKQSTDGIESNPDTDRSFIGNEYPDGVTHHDYAQNTGRTLLEIPLSWLVRAGLASNRGLIMVGVLLGVLLQFDLEKNIDIEQLEKFIPANADTRTIGLLSAIGLIISLLMLRLLGIGWYILRFFGYRLVRRGEDLRISCGLLTKVSATVPRGRIQFISIQRNLILRWLGYASVRIETAGGAGKNHEDATTTVSRRWFVPIIPAAEVASLLAELRPGLLWDESTLDFQPLSNRAGRRLSRLAIVASVLLAGVGFLILRPWGWLLGVVALPILVMWAIKKSRSMHYAQTSDGVVYRSGVFNRKTSLTFFERIQTVRLDQTPFDRRWKMARLSVDTAAAGPAEHRIDVPLLDESFAFAEHERLRMRTARHQPVFK